MPPQEKVIEHQQQQQSDDGLKMDNTIAGYTNKAFVGEENHNCGEKKSEKGLNETSTLPVNPGGSFEFDDLFPHIGAFGYYQIFLFLMMIPFAFFVAWVYFTQIFITLVPENHWCWVPELENLTVEERIALAIPMDGEVLNRCSMYDVNYTEIIQKGVKSADPSWKTIRCRSGWEYNTTEVPYSTIATENDWVCDNAALPSTAQSIFFCGAILGGLVFGWIADRWGRIPALVGTNLVGFIGGMATTMCASFWTFAACRFLVGMAFDNCFTMMYILVLEYVGPKWRTFVANMSIAIFFTFAASILPWIALWTANWKMLCYITSAPLALAILTPWIVPESARWLVSQGQFDKSIGILRKFERFNRRTVDPKVYDSFRANCIKIQQEEECGKNYTVLDLFKTPRLRKITIILILLWMAISLVFDGHVRNVGTLGLDIFLTFTIASATEFPADTFLTFVLDLWGRRWLACGSMVISGIFSLLATVVPLGIPSATLAILGRFAINISYNIGLQYAAELLPTVVRAQGVALIHIMGYVASIVAPFVVYLANIDLSLPLLILGVLGILGGILALFLPETLDQELPQTLQDGENFGVDQKIWDFPCIKKSEPEKPALQRSTSTRSSIRASIRGEIRSSMLNRGSIRSRKSITMPENLAV
ncbi:solute carrier family 22 member 13 [Anthonomus grandis grandis]|uniref:solute carrier family 22 member 13 n=1 Tax=Anthonomus grandis grandis TaxID=2921223 RepID=UPI0021655F52|nr:solute carrier family 22 member 13 [Anthonomus grandis grandis]